MFSFLTWQVVLILTMFKFHILDERDLQGKWVNNNAQYPILRITQSALYFTSLTDLFTQSPPRLLWEASSHMQQLMREDCSYAYPPLSIARYSFTQLSVLVQCRVNKLANGFNTAAQDSNPGPLSRKLEALPLSHNHRSRVRFNKQKEQQTDPPTHVCHWQQRWEHQVPTQEQCLPAAADDPGRCGSETVGQSRPVHSPWPPTHPREHAVNNDNNKSNTWWCDDTCTKAILQEL